MHARALQLVPANQRQEAMPKKTTESKRAGVAKEKARAKANLLMQGPMENSPLPWLLQTNRQKPMKLLLQPVTPK